MPKKFRVTAPDGHVLEVIGPDDATEDEALEQAQALYNPEPLSLQQQAEARASRKTGQSLSANLLQYQNQSNRDIVEGVKAMGVGAGLGLAGEGVGAVLGPTLSSVYGSIPAGTLPRVAKTAGKYALKHAGYFGIYRTIENLLKGTK